MSQGRPKKGRTQPKNGNGANLGFEGEMFLAADKLRKNLEPSDYKHVALGLIFLKHISNAFEAKQAALLAEDPQAAEDPDEYLAENIFWVPKCNNPRALSTYCAPGCSSGMKVYPLSGSDPLCCCSPRDFVPQLKSLDHNLALCGGRKPVPSRAEVFGDGPIRGEEPLRMTR
jgi:hypothetical protein